MMRDATSDKAMQVRAMFGRIARRYDLMNTLMTFGMHGRWRRIAAELARPAGGLGLDLGTGTGDLALVLSAAGAARVLAIDFSQEMLAQAATKLARLDGPAERVRLVTADALCLPFPDATFDSAVNGFVLRNVADLEATFQELLRVLKPGGRLVCLEITHAPPLIAPFFRPYFEHVVPLLGALVGGDSAAYTYLPASVRPFPDANTLAQRLRESGFIDVRYRRLGLGVVSIHAGRKPAS